MREFRLVKDQNGQVRGLWLRHQAHAQERRFIAALLVELELPKELVGAVLMRDYRVVPNTFDNREGYFVMLETALAPGEQCTKSAADAVLCKSADEFIRRAALGPANYRTDISDFPRLYGDLTSALKDTGMSMSTILNLVSKLFAVCPDCRSRTVGNALAEFAAYASAGREKLLVPGEMARLLTGVCYNDECSSRDIVCFWRADENPNTTRFLHEIGIPTYSYLD
jgi:hypothetical protein